MTMRVSTLLGWRPSDLGGSAAGVQRVRAAVEEAESGLGIQIRRLEEVWVSEAGAVAAGAVKRLRRRLAEVAENLGPARRTLLAAGDAFAAAQGLLVRAGDLAADNDGVMRDDGSVVPPAAPVAAPGGTIAWSPTAHAAQVSACADAATMAREALDAATEADRDAARALRALTAGDGPIGKLVTAIESRALPSAGADPVEVAAWWASLSPAEQDQLIADCPRRLGNLDGLPAAVRDVANRRVLADALLEERAKIAALEALLARLMLAMPESFDSPGLSGGDLALPGVVGVEGIALAGERNAGAVARQALAEAKERLAMLAAVDRQLNKPRGVPASLFLLDTTVPGRAAIGYGDLDAAANVAVLVPGMNSRVTNYMGAISANAARVARLALDIEDNNPVKTGATATLAWIGYGAPVGAEVATTAFAEAGAPRLASTLNGLQAAQGALGQDPHLTVLGHSYGSLVSGLAATGDVPVDDLVLFGSPGAGVRTTEAFSVPAGHVYAGEARGDFVADLDAFGPDPVRLPGVTPFQTDGGFHPLADGDTLASAGHSEYYAEDSESLWNIAAVVTDRSEKVTVGSPKDAGDWMRTALGVVGVQKGLNLGWY